MKKGWIIISKIEMTKLWHNDAFVAVTIAKLLPQQIVRVKTVATDGYNALVIGVVHKKKVWEFAYLTEFRLADDAVSTYADRVGEIIDLANVLSEVTWFSAATATSKGKWFQGAVKRHNLTGNFATHGHKFTRVVGSMGNRKPRRTMKWHPAAGHMWLETVTIKNISIMSRFTKDGDQYICLKWSLPGWRNCYVKTFFQ
jgi:large subunit ribosomal protein L3